MLKEEDIRPKSVFDEYLRLAKIDAKNYFDGVFRKAINCPACGNKGEVAFNKYGFDYELCPACDTLFVSPRPLNEAFIRYYQDAPSTKFWSTTFYKATANERREKLWKPKALLINNIINSFGNGSEKIVDIGGGYGIFAQEMLSSFGTKVTIIEPSIHLAKNCRDFGHDVIEKFLEDVKASDLPEGNKVFVSFELFEHLHSPKLFLKQLYSLMNSGDFFIFTTLSGIGLDIKGLWEDSKSISPPHHLNFLNPISIKILAKSIGFETIKVSTPGKLDVDILSSNIDLIKDRFLKSLIRHTSEDKKSRLQKIISNSGFSSHMMVCCKKI
jgi:hypothetical protein